MAKRRFVLLLILVGAGACRGWTCRLQSPIVLITPDAGAPDAGAPAPRPLPAVTRSSFGEPEPVVVRPSDLPGGPHAVDPLALLPRAKELSLLDGGQLQGIAVDHVGPSGLVDLADPRYEATIEYDFILLPPRVDSGAPLGASNPDRVIEAPTSFVRVDADGMHAPIQQFMSGDVHLGPEPTCPLRRLWAAAIRAGAPRNAVANLGYGEEDGRWEFAIEGTKFEWMIVDKTCRIE